LGWGRERVGGDEGSDRRGKGEEIRGGEGFEIGKGILGVGNDTGGKREGVAYSLYVDCLLFGTAVLRMGDGNKVVYKAHEAEFTSLDRAEIGAAVEIGVAEVEEDCVFEVSRKPG